MGLPPPDLAGSGLELAWEATGGEVGAARGEVGAGLGDGEVGAGRVEVGAGCGNAGARATETADEGVRQPGGVDVVGVVGAELRDEK